jgi:restriction system protein
LITLPWWLSLTLGAVVYIGLKFVLPNMEFDRTVFNAFGKAASSFANIAAGIFLLASALSFFLQFRKRRLVDNQTSIDSIKALSWKEFEFLLGEAFRRQGYSIKENLKGGADGGVDLVLTQDGKVTLVQCKNWRTASVGVSVVRELFGVVKAEGAHNGIVVCSGGYTREAIEFAEKSGIELLGGDELGELIAGVQNAARFEPMPAGNTCPLCGSEMIQRVAKKGKNLGNSFWGCSQYPKCKGTR